MIARITMMPTLLMELSNSPLILKLLQQAKTSQIGFYCFFVGAIVVFVERLGAVIFGIVAIHVMLITPHTGGRTAASITMTIVMGFLMFIAAIAAIVATVSTTL